MTKADRVLKAHDLIVTEGLHRRKRSLLIFAALLALIGVFAEPGEVIPLGLYGAAGANGAVTAEVDVLAWVLLGAASYYMFGFISEVAATVPLNSEMAQEMAQHRESEEAAFRQLEELRMELLDFVQGTLKSVQTAGHLAVAFVRTKPDDIPLPETLEGEVRAMLEMQESPQQLADTIRAEREASTLANVITKNREAYERVHKAASALSTRIDQFTSQLDGVSGALTRLEDKATLAVRNSSRIRRSIAGVRRFDFYAFEVGGAVGAFLVAIAASGHLLLAALPPVPPSAFPPLGGAPSRTPPDAGPAEDRPPPAQPR